MKKTILYLCAGALALSLTACGGESPEEGVSGSASQGTEQTGGSQGADAEDSGQEGNTESGGSAAGEENTESGGSDEQPGDAGSDAAEGWSQEMAELRAAVVEAVGEDDYWPDMPMEQDMFQMIYGITSDMYEDYMAETPMIGTNVDTLIIIRAKEDQADTVFDTMTAYRENLVNDTMQYPMNLGKIQASRLEREGNYIIFIQLGGETPDEMEDAIVQCRDANQKAWDAIQGILSR